MVTTYHTKVTINKVYRIFQAKAATLTIAQGFSLAYQSWQAVQVPVKRENEERNYAGNVVVTQAVVEKQPDAADESFPTAGNSIQSSKLKIEYQF